MTEFLIERFAEAGAQPAIIHNDAVVGYDDLTARITYWENRLRERGVAPGDVVAVVGDYGPNTIALTLALSSLKSVIVPLSAALQTQKIEEFCATAGVSHIFRFDPLTDELLEHALSPHSKRHALIDKLQNVGSAGLILFSSGSTGPSKAALVDFDKILEKFQVRKKLLRTAGFLLFDHIGGINTLLYVLSNLGTYVTLSDRSPASVLACIEKHRIELLPTSPTFIKLILISEAYKDYDLSSLQLVTYGTEPMAQPILEKFAELMPNVRLQQTYGLTEVGILRSKSRGNNSLWVKIGGEGYQWRVVDGILQIRSSATMLGYLNAEAPITGDGWFITGDEVEVDGEFLRILGRRSELINVGGLKVYPAEVEGVIEMVPFVESVTVRGEPNAILGNVVSARIKLRDDLPLCPPKRASRSKSGATDVLSDTSGQ